MIADEYLIKTLDGSDYRLNGRPLHECLCPDGFSVQVVQAEYGDLGLVISDVELSVCLEPPGFQVAIEDGKPTECQIDEILRAIIDKLEKVTGQKGEYLPL